MREKPRFYTKPPVKKYNWILVNIKDAHLLKRFIHAHSIIDCGIHDLLKPPFRHSVERLETWASLETDGWKVVPDSPDLYGEFNLKAGIDNMDYSKQLLEEYYNPADESHLPVIQGHYHDPSSFVRYGKWFIEKFGTPAKIGIGTVCKAGSKARVQETVSGIRQLFPEAWIHVFGLRLHHLPGMSNLIDSFDSMSWTFPRGRGRASCRNKEDRERYFFEYLNTLPGYIDQQRGLLEYT